LFMKFKPGSRDALRNIRKVYSLHNKLIVDGTSVMFWDGGYHGHPFLQRTGSRYIIE
jgi:hypothetical protein